MVITTDREKKPIVRLVPVKASRIGSLSGLMPNAGDAVLEPVSDEEIAMYQGSESTIP